MTTPTESGFTLVELLAALTITALALTLTLPNISASLTRTTVITRETEATTLAEALLARVGPVCQRP